MDQYLRNASGGDAQQVREDLAAIGAAESLGVLDGAARWFDDGIIPESYEERLEQPAAAEERDPEAFETQGDELSRRYARAMLTCIES
jgi:hypothetical protein